MPELVEVEIIARNLRRWLEGREIHRVDILRSRSVGAPGEAALREALIGPGPLSVHRRGKVLLLERGGPWGVLIRFGMSGKIVRESSPGAREGARIRIFLRGEAGGEIMTLVYLDARNLGRLTPVSVTGEGGVARGLQGAVPGEDALLDPPDAAQLKALFGKSRSPCRVRLMDQTLISGLGNILVTEILFEARIYPGTPSRSITPQECERLARAIPRVVQEILTMEESEEIKYIGEKGAINPFPVYGRAGQPCPSCGQGLSSEPIGGRTSVHCTQCQPSP